MLGRFEQQCFGLKATAQQSSERCSEWHNRRRVKYQKLISKKLSS